MSKSIQQDKLISSTTIPLEHLAKQGLRKVPEVTIYFWIIKLLTTAMGESTSDFLTMHLGLVTAITVDGIALLAALALQFLVRRYVPWVYWLAALMVAVFGTVAADGLHELGLTFVGSSLLFSASLTIIFAVWYLSEKTLSIHSITTRRRELFYWATVIATFALGTALGDMTATLGLGFFGSIVLFAVLIAIPALGYWRLGMKEVLTFWFAYIITRPLGASVADWVGKPSAWGGLGIGDAPFSLVLGILIIGFVGYVTVTRKDHKGE